MNPFLYKAHPLLYRLADLLANPSAHGPGDIAELSLIFLALNVLWAVGLPWAARRAAEIRVSFLKGYALALPATVLYAPLMISVVGDVAAQAFRFEDRFLLVFALFVVSQMLGGFYAVALRRGRRGDSVGLAAGMAVSLFLLLVSLPACLVLLEVQKFLPLPAGGPPP